VVCSAACGRQANRDVLRDRYMDAVTVGRSSRRIGSRRGCSVRQQSVFSHITANERPRRPFSLIPPGSDNRPVAIGVPLRDSSPARRDHIETSSTPGLRPADWSAATAKTTSSERFAKFALCVGLRLRQKHSVSTIDGATANFDGGVAVADAESSVGRWRAHSGTCQQC
jgi:hypothetical protein